MENEITHQKRCGIGERGKEGPCDSLTEKSSIAHMLYLLLVNKFICYFGFVKGGTLAECPERSSQEVNH